MQKNLVSNAHDYEERETERERERERERENAFLECLSVDSVSATILIINQLIKPSWRAIQLVFYDSGVEGNETERGKCKNSARPLT